MQKINATMKYYAPVVLRVGMALLFIWFGISQLADPTSWLDFVPQSVANITHLSALTLVHANGIFEVVCGVALLFGFFTRIASLLLVLHMIDITYIVGLDAIGMRDFGLSIAMLALFMDGDDRFTLDRYISASKDPV